MFMLDLHLLNSLCFSRHYNYYLANEFIAVFVRTLAGVELVTCLEVNLAN